MSGAGLGHFATVLAELERLGEPERGGEPTDAEGLLRVEHLPARAARLADTALPLPPSVRDRLGVADLWSHQARALDLVRQGRSVALATGTASGKSLVYQAAIGDAAHVGATAGDAPDVPANALLLFPTKALAHDQLRALTELDLPGVVAAAYDGDSSPEERTWVRRNATVVFTNPDMLHVGMLPAHARWATFLRNLRYVVVDELHTLRGIFGSHVAHVLRRLRRLSAFYGSDPTFVFCSATIGSPAHLAAALSGLDVTEIVDDGAPRGDRYVALFNPPLLDARTGARESTTRLTAAITAALVGADHRTIAFTRSRRATEVVAAEVVRRLPPAEAGMVRPYRAGYLATERRAIEAELFSGRLKGVVATSALELGVDIGGLDACVMSGFPGTIASLWQQIGRAGRRTGPSLAVLVAGTDQLDQYLMTHPDEVFTRPPEPAVVNPANPFVLDPQLACAAYEQPLTSDDAAWWGDLLDDGVRRLVLADRLRFRPVRVPRRGATTEGDEPKVAAVWSGRGDPAPDIGLRSGSGGEIRIALPSGVLVGTVDSARAASTVHPGAIYLHQGQAYRVQVLDYDDRAAIVEPDNGATTTRPRSSSDLDLLGTDRTREVGALTLSLGPVAVRSQVVGYQRTDSFTGEVIENVDLELPPSTLVTRSFWYTFDAGVVAASGVSAERLPGALHALEHAAIGLLPLFTICDRWDVGGISTVWLDDTGAPTVAIYDGYPGGAGVAELGFDAADRHLAATLAAIEACGCLAGCPSCVQSPKCGNGNEPLDKAGAVALLRAALPTPRPPSSPTR